MITHRKLLEEAITELQAFINERGESEESKDRRIFALSIEADEILISQLKDMTDRDSQFIGDYVKKYLELISIELDAL